MVILKEKRKGFMFMEMINNKFTLEDLYIGMEIKDKDQLSDIYDTWIMLVKNSDWMYIRWDS